MTRWREAVAAVKLKKIHKYPLARILRAPLSAAIRWKIIFIKKFKQPKLKYSELKIVYRSSELKENFLLIYILIGTRYVLRCSTVIKGFIPFDCKEGYRYYI